MCPFCHLSNMKKKTWGNFQLQYSTQYCSNGKASFTWEAISIVFFIKVSESVGQTHSNSSPTPLFAPSFTWVFFCTLDKKSAPRKLGFFAKHCCIFGGLASFSSSESQSSHVSMNKTQVFWKLLDITWREKSTKKPWMYTLYVHGRPSERALVTV